MKTVVFVGPSLACAQLRQQNLIFRPPAMQGDVYRAALGRPKRIGLIDGYFEVVPSVWHKEILWAITQGITVFGSSSIGALRAAELAEFGMIGVGKVFTYFRSDELRDDSDVALLHGPREVGYVNLSEPQVNVAFTLARALSDGVIPNAAWSLLLEVSRQIFYKERTYALIVRQARARGLRAAVERDLCAWLRNGRIDQKRADALALIDVISVGSSRCVSQTPGFMLQRTAMWEDARAYDWSFLSHWTR